MHTNGLDRHLPAGSPAYPCWLEVDLDAVARNVGAIGRHVGPTTSIAAVVKAEAYGLGAVRVARAALTAGAEWLAVARLEEGVALRRAGIEARILNLTYAPPEQASALVRHRITPTIADLTGALALASAVPRGEAFPVHLKLDTGLSRFGAQPAELAQLLKRLGELQNLRLEGLYSHFAAADEVDLSFARVQLERFIAAEQLVESSGYSPTLRHLANSAATMALPESHRDLVRVGITLSGHYPSSEVPHAVHLEPAASFKARLARVYDLPRGASVGYGRTFFAERTTRAAVVPAGYADGLPRSHSNRGQALVRGTRVRLIGRVSMDQCVVDVSAMPDVQPGDEVVLFGRQGKDEIELHEYAGWGDTIVHEALCRIGQRVPRVYRSGAAFQEVSWLGREGQAGLPAGESLGARPD